MKTKYSLLIVLVLSSLLFLNACGKISKEIIQDGVDELLGSDTTPTESVTTSPNQVTTQNITKAQIAAKHELGLTYLKEGKIRDSLKIYENILAWDAKDPTANLVMFLGTFITIIEDEDFKKIIEDYENNTGFTVPIPKTIEELFSGQNEKNSKSITIINTATSSLTTYNITLASSQKIIENVLIPKFDKANQYLKTLIELDHLSISLTSELTKQDKDMVLDKTEIYFVYGLTNLLEGLLNQMVIYDYQLDDAIHIENNPNFGVIRSNGVEHSQAALTNYQIFVGSYLNAIDSIQNRKEDHNNHVLINNTYSQEELNTLKEGFQKFKDMLNGDTYYITNAKTNQQLAVNIKNFFENPITDIKHYIYWLTYFSSDKENTKYLDYIPNNFDYTVHGLFPDLKTAEDWFSYQDTIRSVF